MNIQPFDEQIDDLVYKGRRFYSDLTPDERRDLVASLLVKNGYVEILSDRDSDDKTSLPEILASAIKSNGGQADLHALFQKLMEIFVKGTQEKEAYFVSDIEDALETATACRENPISYLEELRQQDARERARDMQRENSRYYY